MYCPQCGAEYRPSFTVCSDCQVALVADPPGKPAEGSPAGVDDSFVLVWAGSDQQKHAEVRELLQGENIDARTVRGEDHLIFANTHPPFEVYVPAALGAKAKEVLQQPENASQEESQQLEDSAAFELPAEDDAPTDENDDGDSRRQQAGWHPEDATVEIWAGPDAELADMIAMCLRENQINYRSGSATGEESDEPQASNAPEETSAAETGMERLFVLPEDEARGKEIVREILDAKPL